MILCGQKQIVGDWVAQKIGNKTPWHLYEAIGIIQDGEIVGGAVIDSYVFEARCSVHCALSSGNAISREFLFAVFDYIFRQLKCNAVINVVDGNNHKSIRFTKHIGFTEFHRIKGGSYNGSDAVMFEMQKKDCRWIKGYKNE